MPASHDFVEVRATARALAAMLKSTTPYYDITSSHDTRARRRCHAFQAPMKRHDVTITTHHSFLLSRGIAHAAPTRSITHLLISIGVLRTPPMRARRACRCRFPLTARGAVDKGMGIRYNAVATGVEGRGRIGHATIINCHAADISSVWPPRRQALGSRSGFITAKIILAP